MSLGFGVVQLDVTIVNTALNSIGGAFGDRMGGKRVFMAGFAVFTAASLACALAPTAAALITARAVQGLGAALLVPNSLALLNHTYPDPTARGRAVGIWASGASLALAAGPLAGGALVTFAGWRAIFLVNGPVGLAGLWLAFRHTTETPRSPLREVDWPGQITAVAALGLLAAALIEGGALGWRDGNVIAAGAGAGLFAVLFVWRERHTAQPMLPLALFGHSAFRRATLVGLVVNVAAYGLMFVFSLYFQRVAEFTPLATGLAFLPMLVIVLPVNLIAPRLAERIGVPATVATGAALTALGCAALLGLAESTPYVAIGVPFAAFGAGLGLLVPPLTSMLLGSVARSRSGIAAGVLNATRQTGSVIGVALFGALVAPPSDFIAGARLALVISVALLAGAAGIILRR